MAADKSKIRLDSLLVRRGLFPSRSRARDAVLRGTVRADGQATLKPGQLVSAEAQLTAADPAQAYVSRAALKLLAALEGFRLDPQGCRAADIGASAGGFTQVLLERGAAAVVAVEVGQGQMAAGLRADSRVILHENCNARALTQAHFTDAAGHFHPPDLIVSDVSFISLKLALPPVLALAAAGAKAVLLVKPQFEAGRAAIGKNGQLRDKTQAEPIAQELYQWLGAQPGWRACGLLPSPIAGGEGAAEFLLYGEKQ